MDGWRRWLLGTWQTSFVSSASLPKAVPEAVHSVPDPPNKPPLCLRQHSLWLKPASMLDLLGYGRIVIGRNEHAFAYQMEPGDSGLMGMGHTRSRW